MAFLATYVSTWLGILMQRLGREEGQDGMEYAVVAAVVIVAAATALAAGTPAVSTIVNAALAKVSGAI